MSIKIGTRGHNEESRLSFVEDYDFGHSQDSPKNRFPDLSQPQTRKILFSCLLVVLPMLAFTLTIIGLVFSHSVKRSTDCAYSELCSPTIISNSTSGTSKFNYYVDFPAARLAFLSSLSSTISFSLVSVLMTTYAYLVACELLRLSNSGDKHDELPTPYQTSMLVRILNAELLTLWELGFVEVFRALFHMRLSTWRSDLKSPKLLRKALLMFFGCVISTVLIQVADTYLHISIESISMVQMYPEAPETHQFSRSLDPWCLNSEIGTYRNKNFWSCAISPINEGLTFELSNTSVFNAYAIGPEKDYVLNYTDPDGIQFAIVGPPGASTDLDWSASSFGVSTQCSAIPINSCHVYQDQKLLVYPFNCTHERGGIDVAGNITGYAHQMHYFDSHKLIPEKSTPFVHRGVLPLNLSKTIGANLTDEDANDIFRNPWRSLNLASILGDKRVVPSSFHADPRVWEMENFPPYFMLLHCNVTVWDIEYVAIGRTVVSMTKRKSNGTVAGIPSMASMDSISFMPGNFDSILQEASITLSTPQKFIDTYAIGVSKAMTLPLAAHTIGRTARLVQRRVSKVITEVPKAALWCLVLSNLLFSIMGLTLTVLALMATSPSVYQVQTRLGVAGLVAQLFETQHSERAVNSDTDLFKKPDDDERLKYPIKVGVKRTDTGGSIFTTVSNKSDEIRARM